MIVQHPAVAEAATFAMEDEMYGQDVAVAVRVVDGEKIDAVGLRRWIRGRVAAFKVPKKVGDCFGPVSSTSLIWFWTGIGVSANEM